MNNPLDLIKMITNPREFVMNYMKQNGNPILSNMVEQAEKGNMKEVEKIARNLCNQKGMDFDKDLAPLMNNFK